MGTIGCLQANSSKWTAMELFVVTKCGNRTMGQDQECRRSISPQTYTPWYNNNDGKWYAHRVRSLDALPDEECQVLDPCRINDGEEVVARFKNGSSSIVENHIEDLGSCLKSWVVEHMRPAMTADEERLDACLAKAVAEFFLTEQPSPPPSSVTFSMSPVSMSWNTLMLGSTSPEFSFASDVKPDNLTAAAAAAVAPPPPPPPSSPSSSLISDLKALKLMLHTFVCCDMLWWYGSSDRLSEEASVKRREGGG